MPLSEKQAEYLRRCSHRWNVKCGATGSGKSFVDYTATIPLRLMALKGEGLAVLLGNTRGTLERNILSPMRDLWGYDLVGEIRGDNTVMMFGHKVYALGADNKRHVARIQGATMEYVYGDEVTTWTEGVFQMLKSRLRAPHSVFDGTCNPDKPTHWFKTFLDSDADIYLQQYVIDDGKLDPVRVEELKREYSGTVYYQRYILGQWVAAEGAIYQQLADNIAPYLGEPKPDEIRFAWIGIDFGGNGSANTFSVVGTDASFRRLYVLDEFYSKSKGTPTQLEAQFVEFLRAARDRWRIMGIYADSAEQTLIRGFNAAVMAARLPYEVKNARKGSIIDRIRFTNRMIGSGRFIISPRCKHTIEAMQTALWDDKATKKDTRLDDGIQNVDSLDAMEYAFERVMGEFLR